MIQRLEITGVHMEVDPKLRKYVRNKIGGLDKYMRRQVRESAHIEVWLKSAKKGEAKYTVEVVAHLPAETLTVEESTLNMFAAVDIVETKLKNQLKKYKDTHTNPHFYRRMFGKLRRSPSL
jgi:ribosomal subunit interface protein